MSHIMAVENKKMEIMPRKKWITKLNRQEKELREHEAKNRYLLKAGPSIAGSQYLTFSTHNNQGSIGFNTHAGRLFVDTEFNLSCFGHISRFNHLAFDVQNSHLVNGEGVYTSLAFGPTIKYMTPYMIKDWRFYLVGGFLYGQQAYRVRNAKVISGHFQTTRKINAEGPGFILGLGFDEINTYYRHKIYVDFSFKYLEAKKVAITEGDQKEQVTIWNEYSEKKLKEVSLVFNFGIYFF